MSLSLRKFLTGSWESVRESLRNDLDDIETAHNTQTASTFNEDGTVKSGVFPGDSTTPTRYVANTGTDHAPQWDRVNLSNGVTGRLPFANIVPSTRPSVLLGREGTIRGDYQEITLGRGLTMNGRELRARGGGGAAATGTDGDEGQRGVRGRQGLQGARGRPGLAIDGEDGDTVVVRRALPGEPSTRAGQAVLVGGTVTVTTPEIRTASLLFLQRKTAGGTIGDLTYTQTDNTSFVINSANGADTSTVNWHIVNIR